jgi:hypothetical protein
MLEIKESGTCNTNHSWTGYREVQDLYDDHVFGKRPVAASTWMWDLGEVFFDEYSSAETIEFFQSPMHAQVTKWDHSNANTF